MVMSVSGDLVSGQIVESLSSDLILTSVWCRSQHAAQVKKMIGKELWSGGCKARLMLILLINVMCVTVCVT